MSQWTSAKFSNNGVTLHYLKQGSGAPLVLLHGITDSGACWGRTADALAERFTVYALDQRGHGESDAPPHQFTYADYVSDIVELLRVNGHKRGIIIGHSFGAIIAMAMAASYPDCVSKLVLIDPPLFDLDPATPQEVLDENRYNFFEWLRKLKPLNKSELITFCHAQSPNWSDAECDAWTESKLQASPLLWQKDGIPNINDWRAWLQEIVCPTLLVGGDPALGSLINDSRAAEVVTLLREGQSVQIPNAGHSIHRDQFTTFMNALDPFLRAQP